MATLPAKDWDNRIRKGILWVTSNIPMGGPSSALMGFLWPENEVSIFEALKEDITKLVRLEILAMELKKLDDLQSRIQDYKTAGTDVEKSQHLTNWITTAKDLTNNFRKSSASVHLIPHLVTVAFLHLTALRERLDVGTNLYGKDNTRQWREELEAKYQEYITKIIPEFFTKWKLWRAEKVEIKSWTSGDNKNFIEKIFAAQQPPSSYATVEDTITKEKIEYSNSFMDGKPETFICICNDHKTRMCNDAFADMVGHISVTFEFYKLLPMSDHKYFLKYDTATFGRIFRGPFSQDLLDPSERDFGFPCQPSDLAIGMKCRRVPAFYSRPNADDYCSNSGRIEELVIAASHQVDAMQFIYKDRDGSRSGDDRSGSAAGVKGKSIKGLHMGFSKNASSFSFHQGHLRHVQIIYHDAPKSDTFGKKCEEKTYEKKSWWCNIEKSWRCTADGERCYDVEACAPTSYRLSSWSHESTRYGPKVVQLEYSPIQC